MLKCIYMKTLKEILNEARDSSIAIGHFNVSNLEQLRAIMEAAKVYNASIMIGLSEGERKFFGLKQAVALVKSFKEELNSTYIGPIDGIVNTITGAPYGRINPYVSLRPDLLIATNVESEALYAYLGSQFLDRDSFGVYKYGTRKPDWIIPRHYQGQIHIYDDLIKSGDYEKINTNYCDTEFQQFYLVKTHNFKTVTNCPDQKLTLYKLKK